jgi:hypothetical protein
VSTNSNNADGARACLTAHNGFALQVQQKRTRALIQTLPYRCSKRKPEWWSNIALQVQQKQTRAMSQTLPTDAGKENLSGGSNIALQVQQKQT